MSYPTDDVSARHLDATEVAAYVDRTLAAAEQARIEAHLADCELCRKEVVEVARVLGGRARRKRWMVIGPAAAAAAVAAFLLLGPSASERGVPGSPILRNGAPPDEPAATVTVVAPAADGPVAPDGVVFVWRRVAHDAFYRLTLTDQGGDVLWTESTADTVLPLPPSVTLERNHFYLWYVDVLLPDARSATSGVQRFSTAP